MWHSQSLVCLALDRAHLNLHSDWELVKAVYKLQKHICGGGGQLSRAEQRLHWRKPATKLAHQLPKWIKLASDVWLYFSGQYLPSKVSIFTLPHGCHSLASKSWPVAPSVHITFSANSANAPISLKAGNRWTLIHAHYTTGVSMNEYYYDFAGIS